MEVGLGPSHLVLLCYMGTQLPSLKKGHSPQFSAHDYCGQTAWWIKMPLGMEVGLGPGHIVLHWDPAWPQKGGTAPPPNFRPMSVVGEKLPLTDTYVAQFSSLVIGSYNIHTAFVTSSATVACEHG